MHSPWRIYNLFLGRPANCVNENERTLTLEMGSARRPNSRIMGMGVLARVVRTGPPFFVGGFLFFIGQGMFNAVTTWLEQILAPPGLSPEPAGIIFIYLREGAAMAPLSFYVLCRKRGGRGAALFFNVQLVGMVKNYAKVIPLNDE